MTRLRTILSLPALLLVCGCGASTGDLTGRVLFKDEPLQGGTVTVVAPDRLPRQAAIGQDGSYEIRNIPIGESKVLVVGLDSLPDPSWPQEIQAPGRAEGKAKPAAQAPAPARKRQPVSHIYANLERTPLKITIASGKNSQDIKVD